MSFIVEQTTKEWELPAEGTHAAEIIAVEDLGMKPTNFGNRRRCLIKYRVQQLGENGEPLTVVESFNVNINIGSRLADRIKTLTGKLPDKRFDLSTLVGWKGTIMVTHTEAEDGRVFANVTGVIRSKPATNLHGLDITDEDVPFS
jgi:hypothetical protein